MGLRIPACRGFPRSIRGDGIAVCFTQFVQLVRAGKLRGFRILARRGLLGSIPSNCSYG